MGHKKKNFPPPQRSKQSPLAIESGHDESLKNPKIESDIVDYDYSAIKLECERALTSLRRGNHTKALRLMKEACSRYETSPHAALMHRVQGTVCVKVAAIIDDSNSKRRHLKNAIESAKKAAELSPNSIEFAHFYANLMYEAADDGKEYEDVVQECERALGIEVPIDPGKDSLQEESQLKASDAEARIAHVQSELRSLVQKSNIASLSTWMKTLGTGEERLKFIPIRRPTEDPMEVRFVQNTKRPNEIKKATKTLEEKRKEIEVRVAAARLLQQKSELPQLQIENGERQVELSTGNGGGPRVERRRKKNGSAAERKDRVRSYWDSMSIGKKKELLRIHIDNLKGYFGLSKDGLANEIVSEVLVYAEKNKTWKFWMCCDCNEKFVDSESHMQHVVQEHMGILLPKLQEVLPQNVENEWIDMILNCSWKPLDISAAVKMLERQSKCHDSELVEDFYSENQADDNDDDCFRDAWESSPEKEKYNDDRINNEAEKILLSIESKQAGGNFTYTSVTNWPPADDSERAKILERIHAIFEVLIRHKYLAASHLNKVIQFTIDGLQSLASGSQLLNHGVDHAPICICFLGVSHLRKILKFLQELSHCCGLGRYPEKNTYVDDTNGNLQGFEVKDKLALSEDASYLLLDESLLQSSDDFSKDRDENGVVHNTDSFLSWMFRGASSGEELSSWMGKKAEKIQEGSELVQTLKKEFSNLQNLCERKGEQLNYEEALQAVEDLCLEEGKKRETLTEFIHRSYESVLRQQRDKLIEDENELMSISRRFELDAINNVLKEAEALNVNQFGYDDNYAGMSSQLCDLESGEDEDWRTKDYLHQVDTCIEVAIQRQKEHISVELSKMDAQMMRHVTGMQQLELKLDLVSAQDYQVILLPLVKSFMRSHLEDLAEKDATEKSDAAREAFLAELALDSKKEKTKDKKKNKEHKKKPSISDEHHVPIDVTDELASDGEHQASEAAVSMKSDDFKQEEEEFRRQMELEAEERKLEETLEYQRRIEEEAKQKHLASQHNKSSHSFSGKVVAGLHDSFLEPIGNDRAPGHLKPSGQVQSNGIVNHIKDRVAEPVTSGGLKSSSIHHTDIKSGLSNGGTSDGGPFLDQRTGKRSRKHKSSAQPLEKENGAVVDQPMQADTVIHLGDSESRTLRQLKAEEDDEERFQADLKKAVRQSLDAYQSHHVPSEAKDHGYSASEVMHENINGTDVFGTGLKNEVGEYNCFLNVIIQSLWHIRRFRDEFLRRSASEHVHVGDPCVVCALYEIFTALSFASKSTRREAVAPTPLRIALSNLYPDSNFFREAQMNDASEVLGVIFDCLHRSCTPPGLTRVSDADSVASSKCTGSWDCANMGCIVHTLFGMDIFERMNCYVCGLESRHLKYTSFFHNINASTLRLMKVMCPENSFDELLNLVEMNHRLACDPEAGGCGKWNYIHHILSTPPHVFTTVLGWQTTCETAENITATLAALDTDIDLSVLYRGLDPKIKHSLVSVVCYYGQHYHCFAYSHEQKQWVMYDDKTVKVIGSWTDVISMCEKGHLQPQVLFFEAVN
ncbi:hypothetical protein ACFE04_026875 [Oxalis oulophora]